MPFMKKKLAKTAALHRPKTKAKLKAKVRAKLKTRPTIKARKKVVAPKLARKKSPGSAKAPLVKATEYDRRVFVRFESPESKKLVSKAAIACGAALAPYIVAAAIEWATTGKSVELKPQAVAKAATKSKPVAEGARGIFIRFKTPELKQTVSKAAEASSVSLNHYIAAAAIEWAKEGKKLEPPAEVAAAKAS
jgi:uncharacterized protein (DUF1778 family)